MEWPQVLMRLERPIFNVQGFQLSVYLPCMTQGRLVQNVFRNPPADDVIISEALNSKLYPSFILNQFNPVLLRKVTVMRERHIRYRHIESCPFPDLIDCLLCKIVHIIHHDLGFCVGKQNFRIAKQPVSKVSIPEWKPYLRAAS